MRVVGRLALVSLGVLAAACTATNGDTDASDRTEPAETTVAPPETAPPSTQPEPEPERVMDPGAARVAAGEAEWMAVGILHVDLPEDLEELEDRWDALLWGGVIVAERPGVELDLERPWPMYAHSVLTLDPEARHLLVSVLGGLDVCSSFGGFDIDAGPDEVRIAPRFVAPLDYWGGCIQPGPGIGSPVDLGEPLGERALIVERCVGEGFDDCEEVGRYDLEDLPLAGETTVSCVPAHTIVITQRAIHDMLVRCDPDASPMLGVAD